MKHIICLTTLLWMSFAQADLLDRMKLEDGFRSRIEDVMKIYDAEAKVLLRFDVKGFTGVLPGTTIATSDSESGPLQINSSDISRVAIEIYTKLDPVPTEARDLILKVMPLDRNKVTIDFKKSTTVVSKPALNPLDPQSFSDITDRAIKTLTQTLFLGFAFCMALTMGFVFFLNSRRTQESRRQMEQLSQALSEISTGGPSALARDVQALPLPSSTSTPSGHDSAGIEDLSSECLEELFADCYWCSKDSYAHWLWQQLSSSRKQQLMIKLSFLREYSQFFVELTSREETYHNHPYYLEPMKLHTLSQKDLTVLVQKDLSLWHRLSPLRQLSLELTFENRIKAVQSPIPETSSAWTIKNPASTPRSLERRSRWSELNSEDEKALFANPDIVPPHMRDKVRTLVWLCQKPATHVSEVLARFDARTLAEAWIGPTEVLQSLESHLPEKKLKLLNNYRQKTAPSRHSPVFSALVQEGLKNDVA